MVCACQIITDIRKYSDPHDALNPVNKFTGVGLAIKFVLPPSEASNSPRHLRDNLQLGYGMIPLPGPFLPGGSQVSTLLDIDLVSGPDPHNYSPPFSLELGNFKHQHCTVYGSLTLEFLHLHQMAGGREGLAGGGQRHCDNEEGPYQMIGRIIAESP
ncbi:hypothetical protein B0H11DRAFT_1904945 [Mycena galericulata]|nr:hypothetical protein B0H11DRAFT_1904945 [Mycena galericulata]